ncbi:MAG: hypothetical protein M1817_001045 [Caeruleum heppii]|nr:MAG: hypothetical protein M1817_001045 [Caeruleum heppii]
MEDNADDLVVLVDIPGKGRGMVASTNISAGTRIIAEKPLFTVSGQGSVRTDVDKSILSKLRQLSKDQQREFLSLHNNYPDARPFNGIFRTNALPLGPGSLVGGIYVRCCRINHGCLPNAQHTWNSNKGYETIHAVKEIVAGEEVTIMYAEGPSQLRRLKLKTKFRFDCACALCQLPLQERRASDQRLEEITRLDELIGDGHQIVANPTGCLANVRRLLRLLHEENITDSRVPRAYYDAFQIAIAHGDQARAKSFAERAFKLRLQCEGDDSPEVSRLKALSTSPQNHNLYGTSNLWKKSTKMMPKNLDEIAFDNWLWKEKVHE